MKVRFAILLTATVWLSACGEKYSPDVTAGVAATPSQSAVGSTSIAQNSGVSLTAADESSPFTFRCTAWKQRFADTLASFRGPRAMATDGSNLYVVDAEGRTIRKVEIATGQVSTLAGSGLEGAMDGMGASASFAGIRGLATDGKFLYAGDVVNQKIRKIDLATRQVTTLPISVKPVAEDGVGVTGVNFGGILAVVGNNLYATYGFTVRKVDLATGQVSLFVGHTDNNSPAKDGVGSAATFPGGISHMVTDGENLYVAGKGKENVRKIEIPNQRVTSITHGGLNYPSALTVSGPYLYATDFHSIVKIEISTGQVITLAEKDGHSPQSLADSIGSVYPSGEVAGQDRDGGTLISRVHGIGAIYPSGMVAVGDKLYVSYSNIGMIDLATRAVFPVAGSGFTGTTDGAGAAYYPLDTTIAASDDNLYLWGNADDILFKLDFTTGEISGVAGSDASGAKDGIGAFATFNYPRGMTIIENVMYVSD